MLPGVIDLVMVPVPLHGFQVFTFKLRNFFLTYIRTGVHNWPDTQDQKFLVLPYNNLTTSDL